MTDDRSGTRPEGRWRLAAVDDNPDGRLFIRHVIDGAPDMELVADVFPRHGDLLVAMARLRPDIVLLDVRRSPPRGVFVDDDRPWEDFARVVRLAGQSVAVFAISVTAIDDDVVSAFRSGAVGYLLKGDGAAGICDRIRSVMAGSADPTFAEANAWRRTAGRLGLALAPRAEEALDHLCTGMSVREIAETMSITTATVYQYLADVKRGLGLDVRSVDGLRRHVARRSDHPHR